MAILADEAAGLAIPPPRTGPGAGPLAGLRAGLGLGPNDDSGSDTDSTGSSTGSRCCVCVLGGVCVFIFGHWMFVEPSAPL